MIKARGNHGDREVVILGLSYANLALLREDKPIVFDGEPLGIPMQVIIMCGPTEQAIAKRLANPDTQIHVEGECNE